MRASLVVFGLIGSGFIVAACSSDGSGSSDADSPGDASPVDGSASNPTDAAPACLSHEIPNEIEFEFDGKTRSALLAGPSSLPATPLPLVLNFHGYSDSPEQQITFSEMDSDAEEQGYVVAFPRGTGIIKGWNAGDCCGAAVVNGEDDVGFAAALIDEIAKVSCIDKDRVFSTGYSNGGFLSHRLACESSELFAGIAPVAGVMGVDECSPSRAIPVLQIHGTADLIVPYGGSIGFESVNATMEGWRQRLACSDAAPTVFFDEGDASCVQWSGCEAPLGLCTIDGGGHTWPGGGAPLIRGKTSTDLNANAMLLEFLGVF